MVVSACLAAAVAVSAVAQEPASADDLGEGRRLLEGVRDNVFSFDDPAFYWFCRHVREAGDASLYSIRGNEAVTPWKFLLERPGDYRGRLVVVEGLLQAVHTYEVANRAGVGTLYQCELSEVGTRAFCTVVVMQNPGEIALRSRMRAKGYFIKVRAFQTSGGEAGAGPLVVARSLELVRAPAGMPWEGGADGAGSSAWWNVRGAGFWLLPGTVGLAVVWLILRRRVRGAKADAKSRAGGMSGQGVAESDEDFDWMKKGDHDSSAGEQ
jgi:hypothetical protein